MCFINPIFKFDYYLFKWIAVINLLGNVYNILFNCDYKGFNI